jgi:glycosyltransferase involved in cell wall biosynthesis
MADSIGVVIPTFNRPQQTIRAVNSVLNQTIQPNQIVIVDDGSLTENVSELEHALSKFNVEIIKLNHSGNPGLVRNTGIGRLKTSLVAFLDSDDYWMPQKLEAQLSLISKFDIRAICSNATINASDLSGFEYQSRPSGKISLRTLVKSNQVICSSVLIDREILSEVSGFAEKNFVQGAEDYATWLRISTITNWYYTEEPLVVYSKEPIGHYSQHGSRFPELQAYADFIEWKENREGLKNFKFRMAMKLMKLSLSKG